MEATMTTTPYSDAWVKRTIERMAALGIGDGDVERATGIDPSECLDDDGPVSLEVAGPIDEHLAQLEEQREAAALAELPEICEVMHPGPHQVGRLVKRVDVDLGALCNCNVAFGALQRKPPRVDASPPEPVGIGDEHRTWRPAR
jgi:hypothetical protein